MVPVTFSAGGTDAGDFAGSVLPSGLAFNFADGAISATLTINVAGDTTVEGDETWSLTLTAPSGYIVSTRPSATGRIINDDSSGAGANYLAPAQRQALDTWTLTGASVTANVANDPVSNTATADRLTTDTTHATHQAYANSTSGTPTVQEQTYTIAADFKAESGQFVQLVCASADFGAGFYANFDVQNGAVGTKGTAASNPTITSLGSGWYRASITGTAAQV